MKTLSDAPLLSEFSAVTQTAAHVAVPGEWYLVVSDIQGSTKAIEEGRYKDVNVVGASSIMAVINAVGQENVAFIFGGDGATFLVPEGMREKTLRALMGTRELARTSFKLDLRVGLVQVRELREKGHDLRVARHQLSPTQIQTVLSGDGVKVAEEWAKRPAPNPYAVQELEGACEPDFTGLECRWEPLKSRRGETLSILIQATKDEIYKEVMRKIDTIFGQPQEASPVGSSNLRLSRRFADYFSEARVRTHTMGRAQRILYWCTQYLLTLTAIVLWELIKVSFGKRYREEVRQNSDFRKFDGTLRMILDGTTDQRELLDMYLEKRYLQGDLAYGIHISDSALMTCLIFERLEGNHLHLLDGSRGGYAEAAKALKARLRTQKAPSSLEAA